MDAGLTKKVALVFGSGGGLDGAIARSPTGKGARMIVADIGEGAAHEISNAFSQAGGSTTTLGRDIADLSIIRKRLATIGRWMCWSTIPVVRPTSTAEQPPKVWSEHFESMVQYLIAVAGVVLPGMRAQLGPDRDIDLIGGGVPYPEP